MPASGTGWPGSAAAPASCPRPSGWSMPRSRSTSASPTTPGSANSYLCCPKTLLFRSIRRQSFSDIASGRDLVAYVRQLEVADPSADAADPMPPVRERLRETLIGQLAAAADANRLINQSRAAERTRAGILLLASILTTIMFVGVTLGHGVGSKLQQDIGHDVGEREAITQQGSPPAAGVGRDPAATGAGNPPRCGWSARGGTTARACGRKSRWRSKPVSDDSGS